MSDSIQEDMTKVETASGNMIFESLLDITMVAKYYEQLNDLLNEQKKITLNMEKVERVDGAGLQLIVAFIKEAEKLNLEVSWSDVSEAFDVAAKIASLDKSLNYSI